MRIKIYQPLAIHELGKRANQEDSIYPIEGKATENDRLFLLCDGMGGHEHGEVASQSICKSLSSFLLQHAVASEGLEDKLLSDALAYANEELDKLAIVGDSRQMGTTLTLLYFHSNGCTAAHIGDSRIYHLRPSSHTILYKNEQNLIDGCQSRVWLQCDYVDGRLVFTADSDALIVKGIIALLIRVLSGHTPTEIMEADLYFVEKRNG